MMGVIAKYKFDQTIYENFIPEFNSEFTNYTIADEIDTDGKTIRMIESDSLPTLIRFGSTGASGNGGYSLLEVNELNTNNVNNMSLMFYQCKNLTHINANFNTSNVTNMAYMFNCQSLTSLDVSNFDTSNVTNMNRMFYDCQSLTLLDISNFNTSQVTNMEGMFHTCSLLTSLDVSNFNTSNVTNMDNMFRNCSSLTSLDVSNFDTSRVTNMNSMFFNCSSLTSLNLLNFNTSNVTNMYVMFYNCSKLNSLDLSNFNTSQVTNMTGIFQYCQSLTSLDLSNFNTSKLTNTFDMFYNCLSLTSLNISNFNTSNATNMGQMFYNCISLTSLDISNFDTNNVTGMANMFYNCSSLISLDVSNFDTNNVTDMYAMFNNCSSLTSLDISNFDTSQATSIDAMLNNCSSLSNMGMIYCNADTINKISGSITTNTKIYYSLPDISELEPYNNIEYVKYIFPTKVQLPPHIQLRSLPDGTCDELDVKTGILTRKINKKILNGDVSIPTSLLQHETKDTLFFAIKIDDMFIQQSKHDSIICSRFPIIHTMDAYRLNYELLIPNEGIGANIAIRIFKKRLSSYDVNGFRKWLSENPVEIYYRLANPVVEKLILNYNNSCNYGVILPRGTSDNYNVITNEYKQNLDFIPIDGSITFDTATLKDTTVKFSVTLSKFEVDTTNVRGSDGIYCDNNLFKYETSDNDYEHAYIENDTTLHIYVNKSRLNSYDQVGFQLFLSSNPFNVYYAMRTPIISYVNYEDLDAEKASWEMMDCTEDGSITIESGEMDKTLLLDCMDYVAPTKNRFEIDLLKANTQYTVYAEGVSGKIQLNFGGNIVNFTSGNIYTSGETQLVEFYTDNEIKNLIIIEGDTRTETIDFFEGLKNSENITVISSNAPFVFGKGGKIQ